jgi:RimJ/RimL family protein N-acetyltransferase
MYIRKLVGKRCFLSPIDCNDAEKYAVWLNDQEVVKNLTLSTAVISVENEKGFLQILAKDHNYGIIDLSTEQLIGNVGLMDINYIHKTAEIGVFIGNRDYWDKGYGTEALSLLLDYAYQTLNLNSIILRVYAYNARAIRCYEKVGFKKVGEIREAVIRNRKTYNIILMDILPADFYDQR